MKTKEIRELSDAELVSKIADLQREKLNLKIQSRTGQLERPPVSGRSAATSRAFTPNRPPVRRKSSEG